MKMLDYAAYEANARKDPQWKSYQERWVYHEQAIKIIEGLDIQNPEEVLEIGAFGAGLVPGSDRMDLPDSPWPVAKKKGILWHDARVIPWPIPAAKYSLVVALRVFHHLAPVQKECFAEARRIARYVLIECPEQEVVGVGIKEERFIAWNGVKPLLRHDFGAWGKLYLFGESGNAGTT
jgi:hypothetical protein